MKNISIFLLIFSNSICFAQDPSKQETILWLKQKIEKYGIDDPGKGQYSTKYVYRIEGDVIVLEGWLQTYQDERYLESIYKVNLNDITGLNNEYEKIRTNGLKISRWTREVYSNVVKLDDYISEYEFFGRMQLDAETDLKNRFNKALTVLIRYNKSSIPKETF